jgi:hypothetical protein
VNADTIKLKVKDQTRILEILPEKIQVSPKKSLNKYSPKNRINSISIIDIRQTITITGLRSERKLVLRLNFSEIFCSNTLENDVATRAKGTESNSFARSKKPADSDEKYLFMNIGGNK